MEAHRTPAPQYELSFSLKLPLYRQILLPQKRVTFVPPRVCDSPRSGAARKPNWTDNVRMIDERNKGSVMTEDGTSIRVRIDDEGYTHITVTQWDENGREIVYREDETFQCSEPQF